MSIAPIALPCTWETFVLENRSIGYWLPDPSAVADAFQDQQHNNTPPYWAKLWASAPAMIHFLAAHPSLITHKKVLELGAGLGLPSLWIAPLAKIVYATDIEADAVAVVQHAAALQGLQNVKAHRLDWTEFEAYPEAEVILLCDGNYSPTDFNGLQSALLSAIRKGKIIVIATPQRRSAALFLTPLLPFVQMQHLVDMEDALTVMPISIFILQSSTSLA